MQDKNLYKLLLDNISDGVYFVDLNRKITLWNRAAEQLTGYMRNEVIGKNCGNNVLMHVDEHGKALCGLACPLTSAMKKGDIYEAEVYLHHKDGHRSPVKLKSAPMYNSNGQITGAIEIFSNSTSKITMSQKIEELQRMAMFDILTEVENRRYAEIELNARIDEMIRYNRNFGVLFIDIDNFKKVNDSYGHIIGDRVLMMVAKTLSKSLRQFDFVSRWGGEEFIVGVVNVNEEQLHAIADKLCSLVEQSSLTVEKSTIRVTVSIGATMAVHGDTVETLIRRSDNLMYHSKALGKNCVSMRF